MTMKYSQQYFIRNEFKSGLLEGKSLTQNTFILTRVALKDVCPFVRYNAQLGLKFSYFYINIFLQKRYEMIKFVCSHSDQILRAVSDPMVVPPNDFCISFFSEKIWNGIWRIRASYEL